MKFKFMLLAMLTLVIATESKAQQKPNILVIWGDDIGTWNISHNNRGMMGYRTPNIDRIAKKVLPLPIIMPNKAVLQEEQHLLVVLYQFVLE